jgi:TPR repeat protein
MSAVGLIRIRFLAFACFLFAIQMSLASAAPIQGFIEVQRPGKGAHGAGNFALNQENYSEALRWFQIGADAGFAPSQDSLAYMYYKGIGVRQSYSEALYWFRKAALQGYAESQYALGVLYSKGHGVVEDQVQAVQWFKSAAAQGHIKAIFNLALGYYEGVGVPLNVSQAAFWWNKSAEQGHALSQFKLANLYYDGDGVKKDLKRAAFWYEKAAQQGDSQAQGVLGMMYANGLGVPRDDVLAFRWWLSAAEQGHARAQAALASIYLLGRGVPMDLESSYFWSLLASAQGSVVGQSEQRDRIERLLTRQQVANVQAAARNWRPTNGEPAGAMGSQTNGRGNLAGVPHSTGTGFRVSTNRFVTVNHVISDCRQVRVDGSDAQVEKTDPRTDLALLVAQVQGPSASLRGQRANLGESVTVAGFPLRGLLSGFQVTSGTLAGLSGLRGDTTQFQITAPVQPGNSGGPVVDVAGHVIGVIVSKLDAVGTARITGDIPQNVNFAVSANALRSFLDAAGADYTTSLGETPLAATTIARQAQGYVVRVECWR